MGTYSLLGALLSLWEPHWQAILLIAALTIGIAALCSVAYHKAHHLNRSERSTTRGPHYADTDNHRQSTNWL